MNRHQRLFLAGVLALLGGCAPSPEEVHTVDWYVAHKPEREAKLAECRSNPGELAQTPNCVNAGRAKDQAVLHRANKKFDFPVVGRD